MDALLLVLISGGCLLAAYLTLGRWLSKRVFQLDDDHTTPAVALEDGTDYVPTKRSIIFGHHFTSIAGTGPIVGPAIAVMWGWLPALLWVILGSIFVGAVHDLGSIVVSLRNKGRSIGDIAGDLLGPRARLVFLGILIVGLWIVLAIFGLVIAAVLKQYPAAVTPVLAQIPLAVIIGALIHRRGASIFLPSAIVLALMYASVVFGDWGPLHTFNTTLASLPIWAWVVGLLAYAYVASVLPVWVLLQPRDYINALQLITTLALIVVGLVVAATLGGAPGDLTTEFTEHTEQAVLSELGTPSQLPPASPDPTSVPSVSSVVESSSQRPTLSIVAPMVNWQPTGAPPLFPVLFITIACGACSGFHCLVGSGTSSKQIAKESHAKAVGYGSMLTEGFLAVLVIAACAAGIGLGVTRAHDDSTGSVSNHAVMGMTGTTTIDTPSTRYIVTTERPADDSEPVRLLARSEPLAHIRAKERLFEDIGRLVREEPDQSLQAEAHRDWNARLMALFEAAQPPYDEMIAYPKLVASVEGEAVARGILVDGSSVRAVLPASDGTIAPGSLWISGPLAFNKQYESWQSAGSLAAKVGAFVEGAANLVASMGIPIQIAIALMAVMVASFAATTMDTACRLQRYVVQELSRTFLPKPEGPLCPKCGYDLAGLGSDTEAQRHEGTEREQEDSIRCPECGATHELSSLCASVPLSLRASPWNPFRYLATTHGATLFAVVTAALLAAIPPSGSDWGLADAGKGGLILWPLFGATNQLLAGFAFVVITAWLIATKRPWAFAILPGTLMLVVPAAAMVWQGFIGNEANPSWVAQRDWLLVSIAAVALGLEAWLLVETGLHWKRTRPFDELRA